MHQHKTYSIFSIWTGKDNGTNTLNTVHNTDARFLIIQIINNRELTTLKYQITYTATVNYS